jgi:hypothetical protein
LYHTAIFICNRQRSAVSTTIPFGSSRTGYVASPHSPANASSVESENDCRLESRNDAWFELENEHLPANLWDAPSWSFLELNKRSAQLFHYGLGGLDLCKFELQKDSRLECGGNCRLLQAWIHHG